MKKEGTIGGFTLVELLIVIALISVLAAALVATLNPIEQINKARDARYKNDAAELLAAEERYYASTQAYPWAEIGGGYCSGGADCTTEDEYGSTGEAQGVGVCGAACTTDGMLIDAGELKPAFKNKDQFSAADDINKLYLYKETGSSGSVYVCFIPKAGTNRDTAKNPNLRLWDLFDDAGAYQSPVTCSTLPTTTQWDTATTACFICIPE